MLKYESTAQIMPPTAVCMTYEGQHPELLELAAPFTEYIEVTPDTIAQRANGHARLRPEILRELSAIAPSKRIVAHGVGLSIGSHDGYSTEYLHLLDEFTAHLDIEWHSEHLGYTKVDGENLGTMLALPKTQDVLDMICERVCVIQDRYQKPFLIENIVHLLPDYPGDYSEAAFLNTLARRTGCGLILDLYNLECDARNQGFEIQPFLNELDMGAVWEIHLAAGVEEHGYLLDVHSRPLRNSTLALTEYVLQMPDCAPRAVTFELLREAIPLLGYETIVGELKRIHTLIAGLASHEPRLLAA